MLSNHTKKQIECILKCHEEKKTSQATNLFNAFLYDTSLTNIPIALLPRIISFINTVEDNLCTDFCLTNGGSHFLKFIHNINDHALRIETLEQMIIPGTWWNNVFSGLKNNNTEKSLLLILAYDANQKTDLAIEKFINFLESNPLTNIPLYLCDDLFRFIQKNNETLASHPIKSLSKQCDTHEKKKDLLKFIKKIDDDELRQAILWRLFIPNTFLSQFSYYQRHIIPPPSIKKGMLYDIALLLIKEINKQINIDDHTRQLLQDNSLFQKEIKQYYPEFYKTLLSHKIITNRPQATLTTVSPLTLFEKKRNNNNHRPFQFELHTKL